MMALKQDLSVFSCAWRLLLSISLLSTWVGADVPKRNQYLWKTGTWGRCVAQDCGSSGAQSRSVWCVHSDGWSTHQSSCAASERPERQRACVKACEWHRALFEWRPSPWGPCAPAPPLPAAACVTAQRGVQRRDVTCARRSDGTAVSARVCEAFSPPPGHDQACLLPCPLACVVSAFSHWSACSGSCGSALQHRTRRVLAAPLYGGADCPGLTQTRRCDHGNTLRPLCPPDQQEHSYSMWAGPWNACRIRGALPSGRTTLDFNADVSGGKAVTWSNTVKRHAQSIDHHSRHHDHHGPKASWDIHIGYQTRQLRCTRSDGKNAMLSLCDHDNAPVNFQSCVMPRDCEVSDWSPWSPCSKTCHTADLSPGYRTRERSLRMIPIGGGKECPTMEEKVACNVVGDLLPHCPRYEWKVTNWGKCLVTPLLGQQDLRHGNTSLLCGGGIQTRETYCVRILDDTTPSHMSRPVGRSLCSGPLPSLAQPCSAPCPKPCSLSPWSAWGPCLYDDCLEPQGRKGFRLRTRLVVSGPLGESDSCPHVTEAMACDDPVCFLWQVTPQGACTPQEGACGPGARDQSAECVAITGEAVPSDRCLEDVPPARLPCEVPCPGGCVLGSWGPWSRCSVSCSEGRQSRTRSVLAPPGEEGKACLSAPALEQWRPCSTHPCMVFYWEVSLWGPCTPDPLLVHLNATDPGDEGTTCGVGAQTRQVTCMKANNGQVTSKRCPDSCRPAPIQPCLIPCKTDCIVTPFSEWSSCPSTCTSVNSTVATQSRHRIIMQRSADGGQECPDTLYEERECELSPFCPTYRWQTHRWHQCTLVPDSVRQAVGGPVESCGRGLETRGERQEGVVPRAGAAGESRGYEEEACQVPCPLDCRLSEWSAWSPCSTPCGVGLKVRSQWLREKPFNGGRPCPKLDLKNQVSEVVPCYTECSQYVWEVEPWSMCTISTVSSRLNTVEDLPSCGEGVQSRKVRCVRRDGERRGESVDESLCDQEDLPISAQTCLMHCPAHCVTSPWSEWSSCPRSCDQSVARWSVRDVLRPPAGGHSCPKLNQTEPCVLNSTCFTYTYRYSEWSTCQLNDNAVCGQGMRTRLLNCVRSDGKLVEMNMCKEFGPMQEELSVSCEVDYPVNCLLSEWSPWSECSHTCGSQSQMTRSRVVFLQAAEGGRPCPSQLSQTKACPIMACYTWLLGGWSPCNVEGAECGEGVRERNLTCVVHWGSLSALSSPKPVEEEKCEEKLSKASGAELQLPCSVPCPGDCHLTEWSPWSSCQLMCLDGRSFEMWGRQARSRAVVIQVPENQEACPKQVYEERPCKGGTCHSYEWRMGGWSDNERTVWCQRSDGINVTGGCLPQSRPSTVRRCHPPCTKPFSFCTQSGVCGCERGFTEVMTSHGFLDYCTRTPGSDHKKADVKTSSRLRPGSVRNQNGVSEWALRPLGPDGRVRPWVYGLMATGFVLILLIITMSFLLCKNPTESPSCSHSQKALRLAYDGDVDM